MSDLRSARAKDATQAVKKAEMRESTRVYPDVPTAGRMDSWDRPKVDYWVVLLAAYLAVLMDSMGSQ